MSNAHAKIIPLYNKDCLSASAYCGGQSHVVQLRYGDVILSERQSLKECMIHSYIGVRLKSPKFHDWLSTNVLRHAILRDLVEMDAVIDGTILHPSNSMLTSTLEQGMRWNLDNKLHVTLDPKLENPTELIEKLKEEFFKGTRLIVQIKLQTGLKDITGDNDEFGVVLMEDKKQKETFMTVAENHLHHSCFNKEWIDNAKNSFNAYRRASAPVQPGFNPAMYHPNAPIHPGIQIPTQQFGVGIDEQNPLYTYGSGTAAPAQFKLQGKTGDVDITLNGSTVSLQATSVSIEAPKIDVVNHDAQGYTTLKLNDMPDAPQITADGTSIFKMKKGMADKIQSVVFDVYHKLPYINAETRLPISFQEFVETKLCWDWEKTTINHYLMKDYRHDDQGRDPQVRNFISYLAEWLQIRLK